MSYHHININQLTNIEVNHYLGVNARECAHWKRQSLSLLSSI